MKFFNVTLIILFLATLVLTIANIVKIETRHAHAPAKDNAEVVVKIIDSKTNLPIENAKVIIVENKTKHSTDKNGTTASIVVPVIKNTTFDFTKPQDWGTITIIAKASGYADHIVFSVKVKSKQKRVGIVIPLNEIINPEDIDLSITVEPPDADWAKELVSLF